MNELSKKFAAALGTLDDEAKNIILRQLIGEITPDEAKGLLTEYYEPSLDRQRQSEHLSGRFNSFLKGEITKDELRQEVDKANKNSGKETK